MAQMLPYGAQASSAKIISSFGGNLKLNYHVQKIQFGPYSEPFQLSTKY
jgi:hypothetical protein